MKKFKLYRTNYLHCGTLGILEFKNRPICLIGERMWLLNKPDTSCIPAKTYTLKKGIFRNSKGMEQESYLYLNVDGRFGIWIHTGNDPAKDTTGCQVPGEGFDYNGKRLWLSNSRKALDKFMEATEGDEYIQIEIIPKPGKEDPYELPRRDVSVQSKPELSKVKVPEIKEKFNLQVWFEISRGRIGNYFITIGSTLMYKYAFWGKLILIIGQLLKGVKK
jgi:hypothetical protein